MKYFQLEGALYAYDVDNYFTAQYKKGKWENSDESYETLFRNYSTKQCVPVDERSALELTQGKNVFDLFESYLTFIGREI